MRNKDGRVTEIGVCCRGRALIKTMVLGTVLLASACVTRADVGAGAVIIEDETFMNSSTASGEWTYGGTGGYTACLTAGDNTSGSIPACADIKESPGSGALRLTNQGTYQSRFVILNKDISLNSGLDMTFEQYQYNGVSSTNGLTGDGISFFLIDGSYAPITPGGRGGALGYSQNCQLQGTPGLIGGWAGIGLDAFGNYSSVSSGDAWGNPATRNCGASDMTFPAEGYSPNTISVRGAGALDGMSGYQLAMQPVVSPQPLAVGTAERSAAKRTVHVTVNTEKIMRVEIDFHDGNGYMVIHTIDLTNLNTGAMPGKFKLGFSAGTGSATNIQEIRNLYISQLEPSLSIEKMVVNPPAEVKVGDRLTYRLVVRNDLAAAVTVGDVNVRDDLPEGLSIVAESLPSFCTSAGQTVTCTRAEASGPVLEAGQSFEIEYWVMVTRVGTFSNTASVYGGGDSLCAAVGECMSGNTIEVVDTPPPTPGENPPVPGDEPPAPDDEPLVPEPIVPSTGYQQEGQHSGMVLAGIAPIVTAGLGFGIWCARYLYCRLAA